MDWHGLARIGTDWQIGQFVCQGKIGTRLARIGRLANLCWNQKLTLYGIGLGLAVDWLRSGT